MSTDQPSDTGPVQEPDPAAAPTATPVSTSSSEGMLMIGALLVMGGYLVFELITREFFQSWLVLTAAAFILILPRVSRAVTEQIAPLPVILKALGYVIAINGLLDVLNTLRAGSINEVMEVLGALVIYGGYVLVFLGARGIET